MQWLDRRYTGLVLAEDAPGRGNAEVHEPGRLIEHSEPDHACANSAGSGRDLGDHVQPISVAVNMVNDQAGRG